MNRSVIAALAAVLGLAPVSGSCTMASANANCFTRSEPALPTAQKVRANLSNGEVGRSIYDAVTDGDIDRVAEIVRANPQALGTHRILRESERPSNGNVGDLLTFAVARCDPQMVGALLELGADPDGQPAGLPLTYAVLADDPTMATMLLQAGANPDAVSGEGRTPLAEILHYERTDAVRLLARAGADVNRPDAVGATPLESALLFKDYASAKELVQAGANPWQVGTKGRTPAWTMAQAVEAGDAPPALAELAAKAREQSAFWPPAPPAEIARKFTSGTWPTEEMNVAGYIAPPAAMASLRRMRERGE